MGRDIADEALHFWFLSLRADSMGQAPTQAERWLAERESELSPDETAFIQAGVALRQL
jgi:hypothetical protein